jgi:major outer membrane protein
MKVRARDKAIRRTEVFTNAAYLVLNLWDRLDLTTTLGATSIYFVSPDHTFSSIFDPLFNNTTDLMTNTSFSYSSGVRFTLWECGCFALGAEGQYFYTRPKINYTHSNDFSVRYAGKGQHLKYYDWQIGLGSAYRIDIIQRSTAFIPYVGVRWNRARINPGDVRVVLPSDIFLNQREQRQWGYAVGATFLGCNKISVTAEGRFANENAFYVNSQFRF